MLKLFKSTDKKKKQKPGKEKMGCGASKPVTKDEKKTTAAAKPAPAAPVEPPHPDNGLKGTHELIKFLGRGGTGDTYLFKDKATGEDVAIKLMKRPLPKVIMPNILREIRVGQLTLQPSNASKVPARFDNVQMQQSADVSRFKDDPTSARELRSSPNSFHLPVRGPDRQRGNECFRS